MEIKKIQSILETYSEIETKLGNMNTDNFDEYAKLSKEYSDLKLLAEKSKEFLKCNEELKDAEELVNENDIEIKKEAEEEVEILKRKILNLENELKILLIPKDESDERNAIVEIRAGTGGEEAALFASDLLRMYSKFSELKNWKVEIMDISQTDHNGVKEVILNISGNHVFGNLKYESGTHRVQRVPQTESGGRVHTSAATVAVLPEANDIDVEVLEKDLRIDIFRSSGPGGQSVNTTDSAVRVTHLPTGVVAQCQDEKSQHKNKAKALKVLRSRIFEIETKKKEDERALDRKTQVGTGDRSQRIRTYNFPQGRVTDHRITLTLHKLDTILEGQDLKLLIEALISEEKTKQLLES